MYLYDVNRKLWDTQAEVVEKVSARSYLVKTDDNVFYRRNRVHLRPRLFRFESSAPDHGESSDGIRKSIRTIKQPERLMYYQ